MVAASRGRPTSHRRRSRRHEDRDGVDRRRRDAARAARGADADGLAGGAARGDRRGDRAARRRARRGDRVRDPVRDRPQHRQVARLGQHPAAERRAGRPDAGAVRPPRGGRERRERRPRSPSGSSGAGRGVDDLVMLTLGTGVGGGVVLGGALFRGDRRARARGRRRRRPALPGTTAAAAATSRRSRPAMPRIARPRSCGARARTRSCSSAGRRRAIAAALEALAGIGHLLGAAIGSFVNIFGNELVDRRRRLRRRGVRLPVPVGARDRAPRDGRAGRAAGQDRQGGARLRRPA